MTKARNGDFNCHKISTFLTRYHEKLFDNPLVFTNCLLRIHNEIEISVVKNTCEPIQVYSIICRRVNKGQQHNTRQLIIYRMKGTPSWNGQTFIRRTVPLRKLNPLQAQFIVLCNMIQHKQKILKHLGKNIGTNLSHQPLKTVDFPSIQIHKIAKNSRTGLRSSEKDKLLRANSIQRLV